MFTKTFKLSAIMTDNQNPRLADAYAVLISEDTPDNSPQFMNDITGLSVAKKRYTQQPSDEELQNRLHIESDELTALQQQYTQDIVQFASHALLTGLTGILATKAESGEKIPNVTMTMRTDSNIEPKTTTSSLNIRSTSYAINIIPATDADHIIAQLKSSIVVNYPFDGKRFGEPEMTINAATEEELYLLEALLLQQTSIDIKQFKALRLPEHEAVLELKQRVDDLRDMFYQKQREFSNDTPQFRLLQQALGASTPFGYAEHTLNNLREQLDTALAQPEKITPAQAESFNTAFQQIRLNRLNDQQLQQAGFRLGFRQRVDNFFKRVVARINHVLFGTHPTYLESKPLIFTRFIQADPDYAHALHLTTIQLKQSKNVEVKGQVCGEISFSTKDAYAPVYKELGRNLLVNGRSYQSIATKYKNEKDRAAAWDKALAEELGLADNPDLLHTLKYALNQDQSNFISFPIGNYALANQLFMMTSGEEEAMTIAGRQKLNINLMRDPNTGMIYQDIMLDMSRYKLCDQNDSENNFFQFSGKVNARFELTDKGFKLNEVTIRNADPKEREMLHDLLMQDTEKFDPSRYPRLDAFLQKVQENMSQTTSAAP